MDKEVFETTNFMCRNNEQQAKIFQIWSGTELAMEFKPMSELEKYLD